MSNGDQTDTVAAYFYRHNRGTLNVALRNRQYEPDQPNFTPRITGCTYLGTDESFIELALLRKSEQVTDPNCVRFYYEYDRVKPGVGFCLTTYMGDGDPLPSFVGEPLAMPLEGNAENILNTYWDALNTDNRVSLAVKMIHVKTNGSSTLIRNRFTKVE